MTWEDRYRMAQPKPMLTHHQWGQVTISRLIFYTRVRYDAVLIYKRRTEIWKDADFDTLPRPGDAFSN